MSMTQHIEIIKNLPSQIMLTCNLADSCLSNVMLIASPVSSFTVININKPVESSSCNIFSFHK